MKSRVTVWRLVLVFFLAGALAGQAWAGGGNSLGKILSPGLRDRFNQGQDRLRVLVLLKGHQELQGFGPAPGPKNLSSLQAAVARVQKGLLAKVDQDHCQVTYLFENLPALAAWVSPQGLDSLASQTEVALIQEDRRLELHTAQGVPLLEPGPHRASSGGSGLAIAVVDTGADYSHPALGGGGFPNAKVIGGHDFGQKDPDPMDLGGHGTTTASLAAGLDTGVGDFIGGVAPQAGLYALKVNQADGTILESDVAAAWDWCVSHQYDDPPQPIMIVSTSLGTPDFHRDYFCDQESPVMAVAAANLTAAGIACFVSSGNDGICDGISDPACMSQTIAVGSVFDSDLGPQPGPSAAFCIHSDSCLGQPDGLCPFGASCQDLSTVQDQVPCYSNSGSILDL
ncbi:MAG: S8 family serine peptidase, partial [Deltaproteobacteria bacterium]|nr:S8 family serine peptidase [Deltaproteobacteria bacterium]